MAILVTERFSIARHRADNLSINWDSSKQAKEVFIKYKSVVFMTLGFMAVYDAYGRDWHTTCSKLSKK